jgi:hypothetical protein
MRLYGGKRQFTRPHQNGALGRTIGNSARFDNKFFRNFSIIFGLFAQVVKAKALTISKKRHFCLANQPFSPHPAPFPT